MNEIEKQLEQIGSRLPMETDSAAKLQLETELKNLRFQPKFCLALCNLISNPHTPFNIAQFCIQIAKDEARMLFNPAKPSPLGRIPILLIFDKEFLFLCIFF